LEYKRGAGEGGDLAPSLGGGAKRGRRGSVAKRLGSRQKLRNTNNAMMIRVINSYLMKVKVGSSDPLRVPRGAEKYGIVILELGSIVGKAAQLNSL
jgi:hypothetical protein